MFLDSFLLYFIQDLSPFLTNLLMVFDQLLVSVRIVYKLHTLLLFSDKNAIFCWFKFARLLDIPDVWKKVFHKFFIVNSPIFEILNVTILLLGGLAFLKD